MTIQDVFQKHSGVISVCMVDDEEGAKELKEFHKEFNENYKIVSKEQWCVMFYIPWDGGDPEVTGPFNSEQEAKLFIENWEAKREASIKQYLIDNPNKDIDDIPSGPCLKAKKLEFNKNNEELINENNILQRGEKSFGL